MKLPRREPGSFILPDKHLSVSTTANLRLYAHFTATSTTLLRALPSNSPLPPVRFNSISPSLSLFAELQKTIYDDRGFPEYLKWNVQWCMVLCVGQELFFENSSQIPFLYKVLHNKYLCISIVSPHLEFIYCSLISHTMEKLNHTSISTSRKLSKIHDTRTKMYLQNISILRMYNIYIYMMNNLVKAGDKTRAEMTERTWWGVIQRYASSTIPGRNHRTNNRG